MISIAFAFQVTPDSSIENRLGKKDPITQSIEYFKENNGEIQFTCRMTGIPVITNQVNNSVFRGQINSMVTAFALVSLLLILQFHSILIGLITIIPIFLTILTSFGIMGISHISLNIGTMIVASIAIEAGIDYTIHFTNRYRQEFIQNKESNPESHLSKFELITYPVF